MRQIVKDMLKCDELYNQFVNINCVDDKKEPNDYSDDEIIAEAKYVAEKYTDGSQGWTHYEMLHDSEDREERATARRELNQIRKFLKKYA
jgi:hypothetical protein